MDKKLCFFIILIIIVTRNFAEVFNSDRIIDWTKAGYFGEIPYISSPIANVKNFGAKADGVSDDYQAIVSAINSVKKSTPAVVFFPEGTYLIKSRINLQDCDGIVFRGEGYKKTKLIFDLAGRAESCIDILTYRRGSWVSALSGYTKGSRRIVVSDVSQFKVGDIAEIQQDNDPALMYTQSQWNVSWAANSVGQFFRIVGIEGNTLIIDPPLNITFRAELNPQVRRNNLISNVGFEDFYIERVDNGDGNTFYFKNAANCWIRRVESNKTVKAHVSASSCLNLEIRECYFHHSHRYDGGGHG
ncbi:MAG: glycoside hydrolase family 55 protein, partial [Endomicrobia bacterium]|nr:glycoside hydrolase family 55 protein [Endomicrobiia bacterium]